MRGAIASRLGQLSEAWCTKADAEKLPRPTASFNPYSASNRELESAFLWTTIGNVIPLEAAMHDGGNDYRKNIAEAVAVRSNNGDSVIASLASNPGKQRLLVERELIGLATGRVVVTNRRTRS